MANDLLSTLEEQAVTLEPSTSPATLPLDTLAKWFFGYCACKNLQPRTIEFYRLKLSYLVDGAGGRQARELTSQHLRLLIDYYREEKGWSVGNTNHVITVWKVFFNFLEGEDTRLTVRR